MILLHGSGIVEMHVKWSLDHQQTDATWRMSIPRLFLLHNSSTCSPTHTQAPHDSHSVSLCIAIHSLIAPFTKNRDLSTKRSVPFPLESK